MRLIILSAVFWLSGCATVTQWIPSFWDANQSHYIVEARLKIEQINCEEPQRAQVLRVQEDLRRFELYSQSKGRLQSDVLRVVRPIKTQVDEWVERGEGTRGYCTVKKKLLTQEAQRAAEVVLGRW